MAFQLSRDSSHCSASAMISAVSTGGISPDGSPSLIHRSPNSSPQRSVGWSASRPAIVQELLPGWKASLIHGSARLTGHRPVPRLARVGQKRFGRAPAAPQPPERLECSAYAA